MKFIPAEYSRNIAHILNSQEIHELCRDTEPFAVVFMTGKPQYYPNTMSISCSVLLWLLFGTIGAWESVFGTPRRFTRSSGKSLVVAILITVMSKTILKKKTVLY
jgi:hypothetical protein